MRQNPRSPVVRSAVALTQALWYDAALGTRIDNPIVILQCMHCLQDGADAPHVAVDLSIAEELGGQVRIEACLYIGWRIDPQRRIEEHVIEQLPREKRETEQLRQISQVTYAVLSYQRLNKDSIAKD